MGVNIEDIILHKGRPARQDVGLVAAMNREAARSRISGFDGSGGTLSGFLGHVTAHLRHGIRLGHMEETPDTRA